MFLYNNVSLCCACVQFHICFIYLVYVVFHVRVQLQVGRATCYRLLSHVAYMYIYVCLVFLVLVHDAIIILVLCAVYYE